MSQQTMIPVMEFYEEPRPALDTLVHCEPLLERSQKHRFNIRPHRHNGLLQLFYVQAGSGVIRLDDAEFRVDSPCLLIVPEMCVHEFSWSEDIDGQVFSIVMLAVEQLEGRLGEALQFARTPQCFRQEELPAQALKMMDWLAEEYCQFDWRREVVLLEQLNLLLLQLERLFRELQGQQQEQTHQDRGGRHLLRFNRLVNTHFREHWAVQRYADELGVTSQHLNYICRQLQGCSALQLIHQRLMLEARRYLSYTTLTVSEVGYQLGFTDPSYFSRFFRRSTGEVPQAFRKKAWSHSKGPQAD